MHYLLYTNNHCDVQYQSRSSNNDYCVQNVILKYIKKCHEEKNVKKMSRREKCKKNVMKRKL